MFPGMNPKKMQAMMNQLGIAQEEIDARRVIIETEEKNIVIENPSVVKVKMQGQINFQISGEIREEQPAEEGIREEDIETIIEKTGVNKERALEELEKTNGDIAQAIINLSN